MRLILAIFLSLLCIALPFQVSANFVMASDPCPFMQDMGMEDMGMHNMGSPDSPELAPCCDDAAMLTAMGKMCNTGQQCSASFVYILSLVMLPVAQTSPPDPLLFMSLHIASVAPAAVWRPPTLS